MAERVAGLPGREAQALLGYLGYRYFETIPGAAERVCYPFGFGLSYTSFEITDIDGGRLQNGDIRVTCRVTNTGRVAGKQVVQLYCEAPQGKLGKAKRVLCAFAKTKQLAPDESEDLVLSVEPYLLASYDDEGVVARSAYVLERGTYVFHLGENVRDTQRVPYTIRVEEDQIVNQLEAHCIPHNLHRRLRADGTFTEIQADGQPADNGINKDALPKGHDKIHRNVPEEAQIGKLMDVYTGKITMDELVNSLNDEQLVHLLGGQPNCGIADVNGFGTKNKGKRENHSPCG